MSATLYIALIVLILFRRLKRSFGFQKFNETTLIVRMVIFGLITLVILSTSITYPMAFLYDGIGIIAGLILAYFGTKHAKFEKRENVLYFRTHGWIEITVIVLFLARFVYRIILMKDTFQPGNETPQELQAHVQSIQDPFTSAVIFTFCTYYIGYFSFVLKEGKKALQGITAIPNPPKAELE